MDWERASRWYPSLDNLLTLPVHFCRLHQTFVSSSCCLGQRSWTVGASAIAWFGANGAHKLANSSSSIRPSICFSPLPSTRSSSVYSFHVLTGSGTPLWFRRGPTACKLAACFGSRWPSTWSQSTEAQPHLTHLDSFSVSAQYCYHLDLACSSPVLTFLFLFLQTAW